MTPEQDANVLYSFHFYDPPELTSLAAYRPGLDRGALARLPFPANEPARCNATATEAADAATRDVIRYYCASDWGEARIAASVDRAVAWAQLHHVHLFAGEFGASADLRPETRFAWLRTVRETLEARGISWALWGYDDVMGLNVRRPPELRPSLDRTVLTALGMTTGM